MVDVKGVTESLAPLAATANRPSEVRNTEQAASSHRSEPTDAAVLSARAQESIRRQQAVQAVEKPQESQPDRTSLGAQARQKLDEFLLQLFLDLGYTKTVATTKVERLTGSAGFRVAVQAEGLDRSLAVLGYTAADISTSVHLESVELKGSRGSPPTFALHGLSVRIETTDNTGFQLASDRVRVSADQVPGTVDEASPATDDGGSGRPLNAADPAYIAVAQIFGGTRVTTLPGDVVRVSTNEPLGTDRATDRAASTQAAQASTSVSEPDVRTIEDGGGLNLRA
ncbi:MAG: hypothetical protein KDE22_10940 [Rhodobacterales bacterium]|nr:hypothetical protein [Rhodobacterales bacterium]